MSKIFIAVIVIILIVVIGFVYFYFQKSGAPANENINTNPDTNQNVNTNPSSFEIQGMKVEILKEGTGEQAKSGDLVTVNYVGALTDGTKFDSSIDRNQPFQFTLGENRVIQGWELGVLGMKAGEKRKLTIPPELGYGAQGAGGGVIPPNATLIFEVELLKIN